MCIPVYMCADGTAPHLCIPLVGVEVRLGTTADEQYISHMASSKTQKRTLEDYLSDDDNTSTKNFWPHFLVIQPASPEKLLTSLSPFAIAKSIQGLAGTPKQVKHLRSGDILIEVEKESHYKNLMKTSMLVNVPVKISPHRTLNTIKGVIRCSELKFTPVEDIVDNLKEQGVSEAQKIIITKDGNKITTATIILTFHGSTVPSQINVGFLKVNVSPFIPNPLRCFGCQQFGHHKNTCKNPSKCPKCSMDDHGDTPCDHPIKCVNCSGDHPAYSRTCSKWILEKEVQSVKCKQQVPFPEARKIVQNKSSTEKKSYARAATVDKPQFTSIQTQTDITWPINATDFTLLPTPEKHITPTPSHATMSTQTVNEPSQQPSNIIEPTTAKAKIPPKPSQNNKSYTRKPITAPQGGSQEPRRNSLGSRPSKGSSDPLSQIRRERSFETMDCEDVPKPHQPKARVHLIPSK